MVKNLSAHHWGVQLIGQDILELTKIIWQSYTALIDDFRQGGGGLERYGVIQIKLSGLIKKSGMSKNMLSHRTEMQRTQINRYCRNDITRLDVDVLARLCTVLDCEIGELLEFIPPQKDS